MQITLIMLAGTEIYDVILILFEFVYMYANIDVLITSPSIIAIAIIAIMKCFIDNVIDRRRA